jgi:hypothetical protein
VRLQVYIGAKLACFEVRPPDTGTPGTAFGMGASAAQFHSQISAVLMAVSVGCISLEALVLAKGFVGRALPKASLPAESFATRDSAHPRACGPAQ